MAHHAEGKRGVAFLSGGAASYVAAKRAAARHRPEDFTLLFTDTRQEDGDVYRFLLEAAADVTGVRPEAVAPLAARCRSIPEPYEDEAGRPDRIAAIQEAAKRVLPRLVWLADGRDLWTLFRDQRMIGNTRVDVCSERLKRKVGRDYVRKEYPDPAAVVLYFGIGPEEAGRFLGDTRRPGIRRLWEPYEADAPLLWDTPLERCDILKAVERNGLDPPRMYDEGFRSANCGGFCVKGGHAHFLTLLKTRPRLFDYHAAKEQETRDYLGKDVAVLRDRRGGATKPLPMAEFKRQVEAGERNVDPRDWGKGCRCFFPGDEADKET